MIDRTEAGNVGRRFVDLSVSLAQLINRRTGVNPLLGRPPPEALARFESWADVSREIQALERACQDIDPTRGAYVRSMLGAFQVMTRDGAGERLSYVERAGHMLELPVQWIPEHELDDLRGGLDAALAEAGYEGSWREALPSWLAATSLTNDQLLIRSPGLIVQARDATARLVPLLPPEAEADVRFTPGVWYYAYAHYHGQFRGTVDLSADIGWPLAGFTHSICHEAYPGHQAFAAVHERLRGSEAAVPVEATFAFANTPTSPLHEGAGENGKRFIGWIRSVDDLVFDIFNRLAFAISTNVAIEVHDGGLSREAALDQLTREVPAGPSWAQVRFAHITHPLWATSFPHYWFGARLVARLFARSQARGHETAFFRLLYEGRHTVATFTRAMEAAESAVGPSAARAPEEEGVKA